jgi:hypothetical protein
MRTAQIYMKIDSDNAALRDEAKTKRVSHANPDLQYLRLKFDTVRSTLSDSCLGCRGNSRDCSPLQRWRGELIFSGGTTGSRGHSGARKVSALGNKGLALRNRAGDKQHRSE